MPAESYYDFLGVSASADAETLHFAFRRLSKHLHPDTTSLPSKEAAEQFQKLCEIYELLTDPVQRNAYDRELEQSIDLRNHQRSFSASEDDASKMATIGYYRALSGGELFSLLLLVVSFIMSLVLAVVLGLVQGRDLQFRPSWMNVDQVIEKEILLKDIDVTPAFFSNSFKSSFFAVT